jgi:hypothetical protein
MPTSDRDALLAALDPLGFRAGRIDLPTLWPAVKSWLLLPGPVARDFLLMSAPGDGTFSMAGEPPPPIAGRDLICIEFGRGDDTGLVLWYADGPVWKPLAEEEGWIDLGPETVHIDGHAEGEHIPTFPTWIESLLAFQIACDQPPLAAVIASRLDDAVVALPQNE